MPSCTEVYVSASTTTPGNSATDFMYHFGHMKAKTYSDGSWHEIGLFNKEFSEKIDFGDGKPADAAPVWVAEMEPVVTELGLTRCSCRFANDPNATASETLKMLLAQICGPSCPCLKGPCTSMLRSAMESAYARSP